MKAYLSAIITASILSIGSLTAQTNVSGFINANTTWTLAGSPYIVTGNALLSQGYTLTIDPGVVVKFGTNNALQIDGQLIAVGTPTQRIVFTSNQSSPQPGDWAKLHFSDFSVDAVYDAQGHYVSGTIMKYCDVLYGGSLMWGSIDIQQCSPYFNHCRIMNGSWCGINFNAAEQFIMDSSRISDCAKRGIYYAGGHFILRNDTFISNAEGAIHILVNYDGAQSRILNSYFRLNFGAISYQNQGVSTLTIMNSIFAQNNGTAVVSVQGAQDTLSCNTFRYNTGGPAIDMAGGWGGGVIHNNLIEYNSNSNGTSVFNINVPGADTVFISNNTVTHNSSPGYSCCIIQLALCSLNRSIQIYNNMFTENSGSNFLMLWGPQTNDPSFDFMYMNSNTYINPLCTYELNNNIPYGSPNPSVAGNYWGSASTSFVDNRIYDYFDFANQSVVYYMPILTAPTTVDTACHPFQLPMSITEQPAPTCIFELYPNPAKENVTISFNDESPYVDGVIEILNPLGEIIHREPVLNSTTTTIDLPEASGVYIVRVITKEGISVGRIVKE